LRDKFRVSAKFRLRTRVKYLNINAIHLSLPYDFRERGRVRFRDRDWVRTTFWDRNVDPGSKKIF